MFLTLKIQLIYWLRILVSNDLVRNSVISQKNRIVSHTAAKTSELTTMNSFYFYFISFVLLLRCNPTQVMASSFLRFLDHTRRRTTVGRTPQNE